MRDAQQGGTQAKLQRPLAEVAQPQPEPRPLAEDEISFLDQLMMAESGGRQHARNPRSSALGPFQFIASTFIEVMARYFPAIVAGKTEDQILQLRTDSRIARDAALLYTRQNAAVLQRHGLEISAAYLRLAFLVGASGALRVIQAEPDAPVAQLLSVAALEANPFMSRMTARELIERSAADVSGVRSVTMPEVAGLGDRPKPPAITVRCNTRLPSCRKWVALATKRQSRRALVLVKPAEADIKAD